MKCPICANEEKWENVDRFRATDDETYRDGKERKPHNMSLCLECGFVGYPDRQKDEAALKEYYRSEYRNSKPPTVINTYTGQRKLYYHEVFLQPLIKEWKEAGKEAPKFFEAGAAFGLVPFWFKQIFPKAEVAGTELTLKYRRVAWHEYDVNLQEDFDDTKKYDLIMSYKVLEHMVEPERHLRKYAESLTEDGRLYISVPCWWGPLTNFGTGGFTLEYYYHPDHINVWSRTLFETLLKKCGLEVVQFNDKMYGETYLCKRNDELMKEAPVYESPSEILKTMETIKKSYEAFKAGEYEKCIKMAPNCGTYWAAWYEKNRKQLHEKYIDGVNKSFDDLFDAVCSMYIEVSDRSMDSLVFAADICMRYEQWEKAIALLNEVNDTVPNNSRSLAMLGHCLRGMANTEQDPARRIHLISNARAVTDHLSKVDLQAFAESVNWKFRDASELPTPGEIEQANQQTQRSEYRGKAGSEARSIEGNL